MEISEADKEKIRLITLSTQVNDVVTLLTVIDEDSLKYAIENIAPEEKNSRTYKFFVHTLDYYNNIVKVLKENEE